MNYILIILSLFVGVAGLVVRKYAGDQFQNKKVMYQMFNCVVSVASALAMLGIGRISAFSVFTLFLGICYGIATAMQSVFNLKAYETGSFAYTSVITSLSTVIPALSGYFIWSEDITVFQIIGMLLMVVCSFCSVDFSGEQKGASLRWMFYVTIAFFSTGALGVMQKLHQSTQYKNELDAFLFISFIASFLYSAITVLLSGTPKEHCSIFKKETGKLMFVLMLVAGIFAAANHKINLYLSGVMESVIFFPVINGGGLVSATLSSVILFKEKLSLKKWIGIAIGIIAVILLCTPI